MRAIDTKIVGTAGGFPVKAGERKAFSLAQAFDASPRKPKRKDLKAVRPNAGIGAAYRRRIRALIAKMDASVQHWLKAAYRADPPRMAQDATPAEELRRAVRRMARYWRKNFAEAAPRLADYFATSVWNRSDKALKKILRDGGYSVKFEMTPAMRDVFQATVIENVSLIKSIPDQYFTEIEGLVMRSVARGGDLEYLSKELRARYGITERRANMIALDQNNKATSALMQARQTELGIDEGVWLHSHAGKKPRPTHRANHGKRFSIKDGWFDPDPKVRRRIWPGELIRCFPADTIVGLETSPTALWRTHFDGPMVHIQVGTDLLKGTPNHPVLTPRGWIAMGDLDCGDDVVCVLEKRRHVVDHDKHNTKAKIGELFESYAVHFGYVSRDGGAFDFHGQVPNGYVDEIIVGNDYLPLHRQAGLLQNAPYLSLTEADLMVSASRFCGDNHVPAAGGPGFGYDRRALLLRSQIEPSVAGGASVPHDSCAEQHLANIRGAVARDAKMSSNGRRPHTVSVETDNLFGECVPVAPAIDSLDADGAELFAQFVRIASNRKRRVFEFGALRYELRRVSHKNVRDFSGHVFTMETRAGYYSVGSASIQAKNCRCTWRPIVRGFS